MTDSDLDAPGDRPVSWRTLWRETADVVGDRTTARWICETASSTAGDEFLTILDQHATVRMVSHLDSMVARFRTGEPLQYVLGEWGFRRLQLAIDPRVLIPRPETELVAEVALELARARGPIRTVVDLGTGSGAIGLALADELPIDGTTVWLTDASEDALDVARANLAGIGRAATSVRLASGSWFGALPADVRADVIVSNPPYVADDAAELEPSVREWEPADALFAGREGLDDIRVIVAGAGDRLRAGGSLVIEIGADQGDAVEELLANGGFEQVEVRPDLAGHDRIAVGRWPSTVFETGVPGTGRVTLRHRRNELGDYAAMLSWLRTADRPDWPVGAETDLGDVLLRYGPGSDADGGASSALIAALDGEPVGFVHVFTGEPGHGRSFELFPADDLDVETVTRLTEVVEEYLRAEAR